MGEKLPLRRFTEEQITLHLPPHFVPILAQKDTFYNGWVLLSFFSIKVSFHCKCENLKNQLIRGRNLPGLYEMMNPFLFKIQCSI